MAIQGIRAMLADNKGWNEAAVQAHLQEHGFLFMQPKIDGMRALLADKPMSRAWKPHKNRFMQSWLSYNPQLAGLDGEVVPGLVYSADIFREAMSGIRAEDGSPEFTFYAFDLFSEEWVNRAYLARLAKLEQLFGPSGVTYGGSDYTASVVVCPTPRVVYLDEIYKLEEQMLKDGWEGGILRTPNSPYKFGRSTTREGYLLKLKRFEDAEAVVVGWEPWYENQNEPTLDPRGYTARSAHQENLQPLERLGAWLVQLRDNPEVEFSVGVLRGVTHADRDRLWKDREHYMGRIMKFKHQGYGGGYDRPRTPVFLNWRPASEF